MLQGIRTQMWVFSVHLEWYVLVFIVSVRIRAVLVCNARFLSLSYSFRYRIIASYHHITASLIASEPAICKESQWYESRVRVNEFLWILRLNWIVVCTFTARCKVSVAVPLPQRYIYECWFLFQTRTSSPEARVQHWGTKDAYRLPSCSLQRLCHSWANN